MGTTIYLAVGFVMTGALSITKVQNSDNIIAPTAHNIITAHESQVSSCGFQYTCSLPYWRGLSTPRELFRATMHPVQPNQPRKSLISFYVAAVVTFLSLTEIYVQQGCHSSSGTPKIKLSSSWSLITGWHDNNVAWGELLLSLCACTFHCEVGNRVPW